MKNPIHSRFLFAPEDSGKGGGGQDTLSKAIAEMANAPRIPGKSGGGDKEDDDKARKPKGRQDPKDIDDDDEDGDEESVLADALRGKKDDDRKPKEEELTDEQKKAKAEEDKGKKVEDTYDKDFPDMNEDRGINPNIKTKFKRIKEEAIKKLREKDTAIADRDTKIKELEAKVPEQTGDIEKHPEVVKMRTTLQQQQELIEKIRLEESPTFKKAYDEQINEHNKKVVPILKTITDEKVKIKTAHAIDAIMRIDAGEQGDEEFFGKLGEIMEQSGLNAVQQGRIITSLESARNLINQKAGKLTDWQNSSKENATLEATNRQQSIKSTVGALDAARSMYHNSMADKIGTFKKNEAAFKYDTITGPLLDRAKAAVAKSAETGVLTPEAINFINAGVDMPFYYNLCEGLQGLVSAKNKETSELKEELEKLREKDPNHKSRSNGSRKNGFEKKADDEDDEESDRDTGRGGSVLGSALRKKAGVR